MQLSLECVRISEQQQVHISVQELPKTIFCRYWNSAVSVWAPSYYRSNGTALQLKDQEGVY